jgi:hypothetical protein
MRWGRRPWQLGLGAALALCLTAPLLAQEGVVAPKGDWPSSGVASVRAQRAAPLQSYTVEVTDGVFTPNSLQVPSGRRVKLELVNHGPGPLEFENDEMNIEKVLGAGARSFVVLPPLAPGEHEFVDEFNPVTGVLVIHAR